MTREDSSDKAAATARASTLCVAGLDATTAALSLMLNSPQAGGEATAWHRVGWDTPMAKAELAVAVGALDETATFPQDVISDASLIITALDDEASARFRRVYAPLLDPRALWLDLRLLDDAPGPDARPSRDEHATSGGGLFEMAARSMGDPDAPTPPPSLAALLQANWSRLDQGAAPEPGGPPAPRRAKAKVEPRAHHIWEQRRVSVRFLTVSDTGQWPDLGESSPQEAPREALRVMTTRARALRGSSLLLRGRSEAALADAERLLSGLGFQCRRVTATLDGLAAATGEQVPHLMAAAATIAVSELREVFQGLDAVGGQALAEVTAPVRASVPGGVQALKTNKGPLLSALSRQLSVLGDMRRWIELGQWDRLEEALKSAQRQRQTLLMTDEEAP